MKKLAALLLLLSIPLHAQDGKLIENPLRKIPRWVRDEYFARHMDQDYDIIFKLYPPYLKGDFNGDRRNDVAIQLHNKTNGKIGIAIFHGKRTQDYRYQVNVLGAGNMLESAGNDLRWIDIWNIPLEKTKLAASSKGALIKVEQRGGKSGVIYWTGKKYEWQRIHE